MGFGVSGLGFGVSGLGFGFRVWGLGFRVWGLGFTVSEIRGTLLLGVLILKEPYDVGKGPLCS